MVNTDFERYGAIDPEIPRKMTEAVEKAGLVELALQESVFPLMARLRVFIKENTRFEKVFAGQLVNRLNKTGHLSAADIKAVDTTIRKIREDPEMSETLKGLCKVERAFQETIDAIIFDYVNLPIPEDREAQDALNNLKQTLVESADVGKVQADVVARIFEERVTGKIRAVHDNGKAPAGRG